jgi:hypothetical protein
VTVIVYPPNVCGKAGPFEIATAVRTPARISPATACGVWSHPATSAATATTKKGASRRVALGRLGLLSTIGDMTGKTAVIEPKHLCVACCRRSRFGISDVASWNDEPSEMPLQFWLDDRDCGIFARSLNKS